MSAETFKTSLEAYEYCIKQGLLSERVAMVLRALNASATPLNQTMGYQAVAKSEGKMLEKYSISPRFAVLERMGLIREVGRGPCPVSGRQTIFYEPTNSRPLMTEGEALKAPKAKESVAELKKEVESLRKECAQLKELLSIRRKSHADSDAKIAAGRLEMQTNLF